MNGPIDIVLPWVNEKDPKWEAERKKYAKELGQENLETSNVRFQNWDNLHLWFRAIEENLPWINKIFLITYGHLPEFLIVNHPKIEIVKHTDYIPQEYLPTFNSNTIEMNLHRIPSLSENFILFSDDVFPLQMIEEEYYFQNDMVCDEAIENIITTTSFGAISNEIRYAQVNNMFIINRYFKKREVQKANWDKWYCEDYGDRLDRTKALTYWYDFPGFYDPHMANAMKKSVLKNLWKIEYEALNNGSQNRFRGYSDVTQYLIRYWQICSGNFNPRRTLGKVYFPDIHTYLDVAAAIREGKQQMISFNENCTKEEFVIIKKAINDALEERYPNKCSFEK